MAHLREIIGSDIQRPDLDILIDKEIEIDEYDLPILSEAGKKFRDVHGKTYYALEATILFNRLIKEFRQDGCTLESEFGHALYEAFMSYYDSFPSLNPEECRHIGPEHEIVDKIITRKPVVLSENVQRACSNWRDFFQELVYKDLEQKRVNREAIVYGQHYLIGLRQNIEIKLNRAFQKSG
jgi:hypothetical protein